MNFVNLYGFKLILRTITFAVSVLSISYFPPATIAQVVGDRLQFNSPPPNTPQLARRGIPRGRSGAGTRGDCPAASSELVALVPEAVLDEQSRTIPLGLTSSSHPTFWFYIPYSADLLSTVQLVVLDEAEMPITEPLTVSSTQTPGIVGFQLPEFVSLKPNQYYRWYLLVDCQPASSTDIFVEGFIQQVELNHELTSELNSASPIERVFLYAENGIWYDALTELQTLRQNSPNDRALQSDWIALVESVGLGQLIPDTPE